MQRIERCVVEFAAADDRILGVYLFGSQISGEASSESDVDLGVLFDGKATLKDVVQLEARFEEEIERRVDLVDLGICNPFLALDAIRGERLYGADSDRCDEFDLYVMRRAGDLEPFERQRRRMILGFET